MPDLSWLQDVVNGGVPWNEVITAIVALIVGGGGSGLKLRKVSKEKKEQSREIRSLNVENEPPPIFPSLLAYSQAAV